MKSQASLYFQALLDIYLSETYSLSVKYGNLRQLLDQLCRELAANENLQMTDLAARINFLSAQYKLSFSETNLLHRFRIQANDILNKRATPTVQDLLRDLKVLAFTFQRVFDEPVPHELAGILPRHVEKIVSYGTPKKKIKRIRVCFQYADEQFLYVSPVDYIAETYLKVQYNVKDKNDVFNSSIKTLWKFAQLNLLDVLINDENIYVPDLIVLEPDYLIDISSLAECFKEYGSHPGNYIYNKLIPISNSRPLLMGNIANLFLDEWIRAEQEPDYMECMKKAFKNYAIEIAACQDLYDREKETQFFKDCSMHFSNIGQIVKNTFHLAGYKLDKHKALLEPSYICEALGVQGRLDYMQRDMSAFIEMKAGKADEYSLANKVEPKENHRVQMLLYMAVLEYNMNKNHREQRPYLLYTRYPLLYPARTSWAMVKRAINLRNLIVADEYSIQLKNSTLYTSGKLLNVTSRVLNEKGLKGRFWEYYLQPTLESLKDNFLKLSSLEKSYYLSLYNFITKEQYLSKSGDISYEGRKGAASLWLSGFEEKCEAGELLYDLKIVENASSSNQHPFVMFSIPAYRDDFLPNFRAGDIVMLYERNGAGDNVTNKLVFKGTIEELSSTRIKIRLRSKQLDENLFPENSLYAVEHDVMDTAYRAMYQGLYNFSVANSRRRELLLCQRKPETDFSYVEAVNNSKDVFERVALKVKAAKDYFLLVGPPGTGKTSHALKKMVEITYSDPDKHVLLLAYTNRAVDEICKSILSIDGSLRFIRIGSELSCEEQYRKFLLENVLAGCGKRTEVVNMISTCRIFVGTVASLANKNELFMLKTFDLAIIDEATQILEPQLTGILCAKNKEGRDAIAKFVLIGDHKQLPAVVLQSKKSSVIKDERLRKVGLFNLNDSLFERLYRIHIEEENNWIIDRLDSQGRMHPDIAEFPNKAFYEGRLQMVGLPHQVEKINFSEKLSTSYTFLNKRMAFIPSVVDKNNTTPKTNVYEASLVAELAVEVYKLYKESFDVHSTLGIITPYRNQIARIKKELMKFSIPLLNHITVDTVERFQGSERDVIIYSFCVNHVWQLQQLVNVIEEKGALIDRKLNVVLTRARKQIFLTGVPELLRHDPIYNSLLNYLEDSKLVEEPKTS